MIKLLDNTQNQPSKFRAIKWAEINYDSHGTYGTNSQIKFKNLMLKLCLCDYSDVYILVKKIITVPNMAATAVAADNAYKKVIFKNCAPCTDCMSEIRTIKISKQFLENS